MQSGSDGDDGDALGSAAMKLFEDPKSGPKLVKKKKRPVTAIRDRNASNNSKGEEGF